MRKSIIAGNWKMNTDPVSAFALMSDILEYLDGVERVDVVICPPFVSLERFADLLEGTNLFLGAQNMYWEERGAYTGEISPTMLQGMCDYIILGHSERRQYFHETDQDVRRKVEAALSHNLWPIICVGENLEQKEAGATLDVVHRQVTAALLGLDSDKLRGCVVAYEPIWAIGTGKPATGKGANEVIGEIRLIIRDLHGDDTAQAIRLQYGGSVNANNIGEFVSQPEIDGALVGGASLNSSEFKQIVTITSEAKDVRRGS